MTWDRVLKIAESRVAMCSARDCINNERGQCGLEYISVGAKGECVKFERNLEYKR